MKISGFTFTRNAVKLYYPIKAAIQSILPLVDEFMVTLGECDPDDTTEQEILSIGSDKIKIIHSEWDKNNFSKGMEYARQTNLAKKLCSGDWLFYIQGDEVLHEKFLPVISQACSQYLHQKEIDGFLLHYKHFWGDYDHYIVSHAWYPREIRIIRNDPDIYSWRDAQSFRRIPGFDETNYYQKKGTQKLKVIQLAACMHHYGFVRPPLIMQQKNKNHHAIYRGAHAMQERFKTQPESFRYGNLDRLSLYQDSHPSVMKDWIVRMNWSHELKGNGPTSHKHELPKYRFMTFVEQNLLGGNQLFGFRNYRLVKEKSPRRIRMGRL
jgi:hypothetical protein